MTYDKTYDSGLNKALFKICLYQTKLKLMKVEDEGATSRPTDGYRLRPLRLTCKPDRTASEASSGAHDLPSLASADMVGLVHHIG